MNSNAPTKWFGTPQGTLGSAAVLAFLCAGSAQAKVETEKFEVKLTNEYTLAYWDRDTDADKNLTVLKPKIDAGYFYLGSVPVGNYNAIKDKDSGDKKPALGAALPYTMILKPKAGFEKMLAAPTGFENVWDDAETGGRIDGTFFKANCPAGYAALGGVVREERAIEVSDEPQFRCVSTLILSKAEWNKDAVWTDAGSGGKHDGAIWTSTNAATPRPHYIYMLSNAGFPTKGYDAPAVQAYAINFYFPDVPDIKGEVDSAHAQKLIDTLPELTENYEIEAVDETVPVQLPSTAVPFYLINDPENDMVTQWQKFPTYTINRTVHWKRINDGDATGSKCVDWGEAGKVSGDFTVGSEREVTWNNSIGGEVGFQSTIGAKPLGVGTEATVSVSVSYSHEFGGSDSKSESRSKSYEFPVPPGTYVAVYQQFSTYEVKRSDGTVVNSSGTNDDFGGYTVRDVVYKPAGWSKDNPCGPYDKSTPVAGPAATDTAAASTASSSNLYDGYMSIEAMMATDEGSVVMPSTDDDKHEHHLLDSGHSLVAEKKHVSRSGNHYLVFTKTGDLVVFTKEGDFVWGLRDQISRSGHIEKIVYQDDGNLAAYGANDQYMWSALHTASPAGTALHLTDDGKLQIVHPDGTIAWSTGE